MNGLGVTIAGAPLDSARSYRIAVGAYIAGGGDGYVMFESAKRIVDKKDGAKVASQLIDHITRSTTITPRVEGRILEFN